MFFAGILGQSLAQGNIEVVISNIKTEKGLIRIALFNDEKSFLKVPFEGRSVKADKREVVVVFENLPEGEYALSVFHDENENGELDKNFFGLPKEGFAFGNNAMGSFGPPSFEKAKVVVKEETIRQEISLKHM
jgi:uncharacterized protein (DUF2141 family)